MERDTGNERVDGSPAGMGGPDSSDDTGSDQGTSGDQATSGNGLGGPAGGGTLGTTGEDDYNEDAEAEDREPDLNDNDGGTVGE